MPEWSLTSQERQTSLRPKEEHGRGGIMDADGFMNMGFKYAVHVRKTRDGEDRGSTMEHSRSSLRIFVSATNSGILRSIIRDAQRRRVFAHSIKHGPGCSLAFSLKGDDLESERRIPCGREDHSIAGTIA